MEVDAVVRLEQVTKSFEGTPVVHDLSLTLLPRTLLVLLGSSGCGKTTTLRLIAGLERPDAGSVWINGTQVSGGGVWVAPNDRRIGMVFQDYALFPHLTVAGNIDFALGGREKSLRQARVHDMLALTGLVSRSDYYPHQLSGGEQQRVALARALVASPHLVLFDEPFSNLDAHLRREMREEVMQILREVGAAAVFVTHDQEEAFHIADRIAIMQAGRIVQTGLPGEVYRFPVSYDVACFLGEVNEVAGTASGDEVETVLGRLPLAQPISGDIRVLIRPETIALNRAADGHFTVVLTRFFGHDQTITVRHDSGLRLEARVWGHETFAQGERVSLSVRQPVAALTG